MKIILLNIDSKLPNIALHKLALWHQAQGDSVIWGSPLDIYDADKVYISSIFTRNKEKVANLVGLRPDITVAGGTGWDLKVKLPLEIDLINPKLNYGFTTRGCIRKCKFCLVPEAEGNIRIVGDIYDVWDREGKSVTLLDNNILAVPEHFERICRQLQAENLSVDFNSGLDIRLVTEKTCQLLQSIKLKNELRFAFDSPYLADIIQEKVALLKQYHIRKHIYFYVLMGFDTTREQDLERLNLLKRLNCRAYVMRYENMPKDYYSVRIAQWANQHWTFATYEFEDFCQKRDSMKVNWKARNPINSHQFSEIVEVLK